MNIQISEIDKIIERQVVNGIAICTTVQVIVCSPDTITIDQMKEIVNAAVINPNTIYPTYFIDSNHPLLGYQEADTLLQLYDDCAEYLHGQGFSITTPDTNEWEY